MAARKSGELWPPWSSQDPQAEGGHTQINLVIRFKKRLPKGIHLEEINLENRPRNLLLIWLLFSAFFSDYVYVETSSTTPFQIRRIEELNKTPSGNVEAKMMCFYRRRDLPTPLVQLADKHQSKYSYTVKLVEVKYIFSVHLQNSFEKYYISMQVLKSWTFQYWNSWQ